MDAWLGLPTHGESSQDASLRKRSGELLQRLAAVAAGGRASGVQHLVGLPAVVLQLRRIAPAATHSALVMQPQYTYDPEEPGVSLTRDARLRGVQTHLITRPATVQTHPLLSSMLPTTLLGPVFLRALVIDGRQLILGAPDDVEGQRTAWYTTIPELVREVLALWHETAALSRPLLAAGQEPPLTDGQLKVAALVCLGEEDHAIARVLGLPEELVGREVCAILHHLGARNRTEAALAMCGRGVNGGRRAYS